MIKVSQLTARSIIELSDKDFRVEILKRDSTSNYIYLRHVKQ